MCEVLCAVHMTEPLIRVLGMLHFLHIQKVSAQQRQISTSKPITMTQGH